MKLKRSEFYSLAAGMFLGWGLEMMISQYWFSAFVEAICGIAALAALSSARDLDDWFFRVEPWGD